MSLMISIVIFILVAASFIRHFLIRRKHPPGPLGLPYVVHLPFQLMKVLASNFLPVKSREEYFRQMKDKYGDIWSIDLGGRRIIGLASLDVMTEAFSDNAKLFTGRPLYEGFKTIYQNRGITFTDGELTQGNRKLTIKALRDLGMGTQILECKISNEVDELIEIIENKLSKPLSSPDVFIKAVSNVASLLTFDKRNNYDDPKFEAYIENIKVVAHSNAVHDIIEICSKIMDLKYTKMLFSMVKKFIDNNTERMEFIADKCRSRMKIEGEYSEPSCVFDYFWRYRYQDQPNVDPSEKFLNICNSMFDVFVAGSDTTTNILAYCCLFLGQYPDLQKEIRTEIQSLAHDHKLIKLEMRKDCPKFLSFMDEVLRYCCLIPCFQRRALNTCMLKGYKIQTNDVIYGDFATFTRDPAVFAMPDDFLPYRFMDESRTKYVHNKFLIPFGFGKRACLGESLAHMDIFLFLTKIIHRFDISLTNKTKEQLPKIFEGSTYIVHVPKDHEIIFELHHS